MMMMIIDGDDNDVDNEDDNGEDKSSDDGSDAEDDNDDDSGEDNDDDVGVVDGDDKDNDEEKEDDDDGDGEDGEDTGVSDSDRPFVSLGSHMPAIFTSHTQYSFINCLLCRFSCFFSIARFLSTDLLKTRKKAN